jgi:hypothetical protein
MGGTFTRIISMTIKIPLVMAVAVPMSVAIPVVMPVVMSASISTKGVVVDMDVDSSLITWLFSEAEAGTMKKNKTNSCFLNGTKEALLQGDPLSPR